MESDVEAIVQGLTKAQMAAIATAWERKGGSVTMNKTLATRPLIALGVADNWGVASLILTTKGRAVRTALLSQTKE